MGLPRNQKLHAHILIHLMQPKAELATDRVAAIDSGDPPLPRRKWAVRPNAGAPGQWQRSGLLIHAALNQRISSEGKDELDGAIACFVELEADIGDAVTVQIHG